ncbi:MAG: hypothetical protein ACI9CE_003657 [Flavobacterium sp.]|jgi:hypothetical protein
MDLLFIFEWIDTSWLAEISKEWGGIYAIVQAIHLSGMALLGGMILLGDMRMLNLMLKDVPAEVVIRNTHFLIKIALLLIILSGTYMMSAVAIKLYYNSFFLAKMIGFSMGLIFLFTIRRQVYERSFNEFNTLNNIAIHPLSIRLVAIANLMIWFSVAASGRWIGFS